MIGIMGKDPANELTAKEVAQLAHGHGGIAEAIDKAMDVQHDLLAGVCKSRRREISAWNAREASSC